MGQRHQAYLRLPVVYYNEGNINNKPERTIGLHHQWLYGYEAVHALYRYLAWLTNDENNLKYISHDEEGAFHGAYSFDYELGYFHQVHTLDAGEPDDPTQGDNNNGITIIDLAGKKPRYCFMSLGYMECLYDEESQPSAYTPIDVEKWLTIHYPDWKTENPGIVGRVAFIQREAEVLTRDRLVEIFPKMFHTQARTA